MDEITLFNKLDEMRNSMEKRFDNRFDKIDTKIDSKLDKIDEQFARLVTHDQCKERMDSAQNINSITLGSAKLELSKGQGIAAVASAIGIIAAAVAAAFR